MDLSEIGLTGLQSGAKITLIKRFLFAPVISVTQTLSAIALAKADLHRGHTELHRPFRGEGGPHEVRRSYFSPILFLYLQTFKIIYGLGSGYFSLFRKL